MISGTSPLSTTTVLVGVDLIGGGPDRIGGSQRPLLDRQHGAVSDHIREPALGGVDDDDLLRARVSRGRHRPIDHRPPAQRVQQLRNVGAHPRALPRGEDDDDGRGHATRS